MGLLQGMFPVLARAQEAAGSQSTPRALVVASTTSTVDSGLFKDLLPRFKAASGLEVRVLSQGTGQALDTGRRGDTDVVFVHAKAAEEKFIAEGFGLARYPVMYNDFILIGPKEDPARIAGAPLETALKAIAAAGAPFVSRGDRSGTHLAEIAFWQKAGFGPEALKGSWYREIGQGMGAALNTAAAMRAYVLADRGTWLAFQNRDSLRVLVEGDKALRNQYGVILVNPARHPHVAKNPGQRFIDWLISPEGQKAIAGYKPNGEQLFFPNAQESGV